MKFLTCCSVLLLAAFEADAKKVDCPSFEPAGDLNNPDVVAVHINDTMDGVWSKVSPQLTAAGNDVYNEIKALAADSDPDYWVQRCTAAAVATFWVAAILMQENAIPKPSLCALGQMVDATVAFYASNNTDCPTLSRALGGVARGVVDGSKLVADTAIENSECSNTQFNGNTASCSGDGFVYDLDGLFNIPSIDDAYPESLFHLNTKLTTLYNSNVWIDRALCVIMAASFTTGFQVMFRKFDNRIKFQFFFMSLTDPLPKPCCGDFIQELKRLLRLMEGEAQQSADEAMADLGCTVA